MALSSFNTSPNDSFKTTLVADVATGTDTYGLSVWIYDDTANYTAWTATLSSSEEKALAKVYSSYMMKMTCNITTLNSVSDDTRAGSGCCIQDGRTSGTNEGSGYCMILQNSGTKSVKTYFLTETNFNTVLNCPYDFSTMTAAPNVPSPEYTGVNTFHVTTTNDYASWDGYKAQPWGQVGIGATEMRFELGEPAWGYIFNIGRRNEETTACNNCATPCTTSFTVWGWKDGGLVTLKNAMSLQSIGLTTAALTIMAYMSF